MADIVEHLKKGTFEEQYWIPAHNKRRESKLFRDNKRFIRDECGAPCWICGVKADLEVHHVFEWSFWNALDPKKVTNILNAIEFYDDDYVNRADDAEKLKKRLSELAKTKKYLDTPDDARNLVVLCREHHRLKYTGIHSVSFPLWLAVAAIPAGGGVLSREQLLLAVERVSKIDDELASYAANNYKPHRLYKSPMIYGGLRGLPDNSPWPLPN
jgi:HNH endonuclease